MYPSRGGDTYGPQGYGQAAGAGYTGGATGGPDGGSQQSRLSAMLNSQDADISGFRTHPSIESHFGGQYSSVYGTSGLSSSQQGLGGYSTGLGELSGFASAALGSGMGLKNEDYVSSSKYGKQGDHFSFGKVPDYASADRHHYGEHPSMIMLRDLLSEQTRRYSDSVGRGHLHLSEMHDPVHQASLLRQQQMRKAQALQAGSDMRHPLTDSALDGVSRCCY